MSAEGPTDALHGAVRPEGGEPVLPVGVGASRGAEARRWRRSVVEVTLGARVVRQGPGAYQVQLLGEGGEVRACRPGSPLEFRMFEMLVLGEAEWFGLGDDEAGESR